MWATTYDMDKELKTDYHKRIKKWLEDAQKRDITISGALTDPKGDRSKSPTMQKDPDMSLRVIEKREYGIVVRGAKMMINLNSDINHYIELAKRLVNIKEDIKVEHRKK